MKKPLALCTRYTAKGASSRLRFFDYTDALEKAGFAVEKDCFYPEKYLEKLYRTGRRDPLCLAGALMKRLCRAHRLPEALWIEYELLPYLPFWAEALLLRNRRYVLNFDDDIFLRYGQEPNKLDWLTAGAAGVICANDRLLERVSRHQKNVLKVPTVVNLTKYRNAVELAAHAAPDHKLMAVWIGTPVTYRYLLDAAEHLRAMYRERPYTLRVIASADLPPVDGLEMQFFDWSEETEAMLIAEADFGIMPLLANDAFAGGKSAYKIIQYLACGLPVIASPVGENCRVLTPECGILASSPEEWARAINNMTDPALHTGAAIRGREYSIEHWGPKVADFLRETLY